MRLLPHYENAVIAIEKLRDYALDPESPKGKNKARVFAAALGIGREHAEALALVLKDSLSRAPAVRAKSDPHGERWITYHQVTGLNARTSVITVAWIYRLERPAVPALVSCYIEEKGMRKLEEAQLEPKE
jgi:filamentous hemagglutinin